MGVAARRLRSLLRLLALAEKKLTPADYDHARHYGACTLSPY